MSGKAKTAMIAIMLGSLVLVFGTYSYASPAKALHAKPEAIEVEEDVDLDALHDAAKAEEEKDAKMLKLAMAMKLAKKDLEALANNEHNKVRFLDPEINKGLVDHDLMAKMALMQHALLDKFDKAEAVKKEEMAEPEDVEEGLEPEDVEEVEVEEEEDIEPEDVEDVVADDLEDEELTKMAMEMKVMEKEMEDLLKKDDSDSDFFDPEINMGFIDRDLLVKLVLLREDLLEDFDD